MTTRVGFIGLGMMGRGMAKHVQAQGHALALLIRSAEAEERCAELLAAGARGIDTAAAVAAASDVVIICVTGSPQVEEVVFGESGVLQALRPGTVVVDCSTSQPESTRHVAQAIAAKGALFLDAAMTGTPKDADAGKINLLVGGDATLLERMRPLFQAFAQNIYHCGGTGTGHATKLLHQFVVLGNAAILAEAFSCAAMTQVDRAVLCDVIASGGANSTAFQRLRPYVLEGDDQGFRFSLDNALKDMHYYARMSAQARAVSFIAGAVHNTYTVAKHFGAGSQFVPHLVQRVGLLNGLTLPATAKDGAGD
jgi:3-hydroxyisobutyrate dehydrogenase-like beta-hydroxyacid dehydrogenase